MVAVANSVGDGDLRSGVRNRRGGERSGKRGRVQGVQASRWRRLGATRGARQASTRRCPGCVRARVGHTRVLLAQEEGDKGVGGGGLGCIELGQHRSWAGWWAPGKFLFFYCFSVSVCFSLVKY